MADTLLQFIAIPSFEAVGRAIGSVDLAQFIQGRIDDVGALLTDVAKSLAPVRTGALQASIVYQGMGNIVADVDYGIYVHEGTKYMAARPFFTEASDQSQDQIQEETIQGIDALLEEAMNKV